MAALHEALKSLGPCNFEETPTDALGPFLSSTFAAAETIIESVPIPAPSSSSDTTRSRSNTGASTASSASEISVSSARASPPPADIEVLQKEWKSVKLNPKENPLGMSVYKLAGKDGKGSWFARRSVHEGLGFKKWKTALQREFPETLKVQGGPGEGNIRGIGGEERVEHQVEEGVGTMEVYLLSAQFPGPTAPRDFVTMFLTSDHALKEQNGEPAPRHFMVVSKPCIHPATPQREGYIRGQYESVEFIREIPIKKPKKSVSTTHLDKTHTRNRSATLGKEAMLRNATMNHPEGIEAETEGRSSNDGGRARGRTISFDHSRGTDAKGEDVDVPREEDEENPVEWIMITRSDPGGSVPRFLIDRGTPGGIVNDASKFLNWACANDFDDQNEENQTTDAHKREKGLHNYETNGHLAGLEEEEPNETPVSKSKEPFPTLDDPPAQENSSTGIYGMVTGGIGAAGGFIASHTPQVISSHLPGVSNNSGDNSTDNKPTTDDTNAVSSRRRASTSSISTVSSVYSFASALENKATSNSFADQSQSTQSSKVGNLNGAADKELLKLEEKKRKLDEKLNSVRLKESARQSDDYAKEDEAMRKATEKHDKEIKKQEEKYRKEVMKLQMKREKEEKKAEERRRKTAEKDERVKLQRELEETRAEMLELHKEKEILRFQVGELQRENTLLAARIGKIGGLGEEVLREVKEEVGKGGRLRATSLRGSRPPGLSRKLTSSSISLGGKSERSLEEMRKETFVPANGGVAGATHT